MLKYAAVAAASKVFSTNRTTRRAYRVLGNAALDRMRRSGGLEAPYVERSRRWIELCDRLQVLHRGDEVLELGTGWLHWEATVLRLFFEVRVTLFDVWDNRLFGAYQSWLGQYREHVDGWTEIDPARRRRALTLIDEALRTSSFEELYALFGFTYVVEPSGRLDDLPATHFALVISADVLEHIPSEVLPGYLAASRERLVPGGFSLHQIDLVDHYHYFDPTTSPKHFYRYDERTWDRWFSNEVQYVNRVQRPQWRRLFDDAGFVRVEEHENTGDLGALPAVGTFGDLDQDDVDCLQMITVHRRPGARGSGS